MIKTIIKKNKMKSLSNCHKKKLEGMSLAPVIQARSTSTVTDLYNKKISIDKSKLIEPVI